MRKTFLFKIFKRDLYFFTKKKIRIKFSVEV